MIRISFNCHFLSPQIAARTSGKQISFKMPSRLSNVALNVMFPVLSAKITPPIHFLSYYAF